MALPYIFAMIGGVMVPPLRDIFPALFVLAVDRDASVAYYCERASGTNVWVPVFARAGFVDDDSLFSFINKLNCHKIRDTSHDMVKGVEL